MKSLDEKSRDATCNVEKTARVKEEEKKNDEDNGPLASLGKYVGVP